jgi:hypothetical protein
LHGIKDGHGHVLNSWSRQSFSAVTEQHANSLAGGTTQALAGKAQAKCCFTSVIITWDLIHV